MTVFSSKWIFDSFWLTRKTISKQPNKNRNINGLFQLAICRSNDLHLPTCSWLIWEADDLHWIPQPWLMNTCKCLETLNHCSGWNRLSETKFPSSQWRAPIYPSPKQMLLFYEIYQLTKCSSCFHGVEHEVMGERKSFIRKDFYSPGKCGL